MSGPAYHFETVLTYFSKIQGPSKISGIQFDMETWLDQAEHELIERDHELRGLIRQLRVALDSVQIPSGGISPVTDEQNRHPEVVKIIGRMADMAFATPHLRRVASHPLMRLPIHWIAGLAGYVIDDPLYMERLNEAVVAAEQRLQFLTASEDAYGQAN